MPAVRSSSLRQGTSEFPVGDKPVGTTTGDLLIAKVTHRYGAFQVITPPSAEWTLIRRDDQGTYVGIAWYWKVAASDEHLGWAWTLSTSADWAVEVLAITDANTATPVDVSAGQANTTSSNHPAPSVTTTLGNTLLLYGAGLDVSSGTLVTMTPPPGMTERTEASGGIVAELATEERASAGATGTRTATSHFSSMLYAARSVTSLIAIRPVTAGAVTKVVSGAVSFVGAPKKRPRPKKVGALTSTGVFKKRARPKKAGVITTVGTAKRRGKKRLSGTTTVTGVPKKRAKHKLTALLSPVGVPKKKSKKKPGGAFSPAGTFSGRTVKPKSITGVLTSGGAFRPKAKPRLLGSLFSGYPAVVLQDSPVGYWRMDEVSGTTMVDYFGRGRDGTVVGTGTVGVVGATTYTNKAFESNGTTGRVNFANCDDWYTLGTDFSIEFWWWRDPADTTAGVILSMPWNVGGYWNWRVRHSVGHGIGLQMTRSDGTLYSSGWNLTLTDGVWHHVVVTIAADKTIKIYVDDALYRQDSHDLTVYTGNDVDESLAMVAMSDLPRDPTWNGSTSVTAKGRIDEIAIYHSVLTAERVSAHYKAGTKGWKLLQAMKPVDFVGALSFVGIPVRKTKARRAGAASFVGTLKKDSTRRIVGVLSYVGTIKRKNKRAIAAALATQGTFRTKNKKRATAILSFVGAFRKKERRRFVGVSSFGGVVKGKPRKRSAGVLQPVGAVTFLKGVKKLVQGFASFTKAVKRKTRYRSLTGSLSGTGVIYAVEGTSGVIVAHIAATLSFLGLDKKKTQTSRTTGASSYAGDLAPSLSAPETLTGALGFVGESTKKSKRGFVATVLSTGYRNAVMNLGPKAYWRLGESSGSTAVNEIGTGSGTYQGAVTLSQPSLLAGDSANTSAEFAATPDMVVIPDVLAGAQATTGFSFEAWIRPDTLTAIRGIVGYSHANNIAIYGCGGISIHTSGKPRVEYRSTSEASEVLNSSTLITAGQTAHVVGTYDAVVNSLKIYVNGEDTGTSTPGAPPKTVTVFASIGRERADSSGDASVFDGQIDEVAVYDRPLSIGEIKYHYQVGAGTRNLVPKVKKPLVGAMASTSTIRLRAKRTLAAALASVGATSQKTHRAVTGSVTPIGTSALTPNRPVDGLLTPLGNLGYRIPHDLVAVLQFIGAIKRKGRKPVRGSLTNLPGALKKRTGRATTGSLVYDGALFRKSRKRSAAVLSMNGQPGKKVRQGVLAQLGSTGTASRKVKRPLAASFQFVGNLGKTSWYHTVGGLGFSRFLQKSRLAVISGVANFSSSLLAHPTRKIFGVLDLGGSLLRKTRSNLAGAFSFTAGLIRHWAENKPVDKGPDVDQKFTGTRHTYR